LPTEVGLRGARRRSLHAPSVLQRDGCRLDVCGGRACFVRRLDGCLELWYVDGGWLDACELLQVLQCSDRGRHRAGRRSGEYTRPFWAGKLGTAGCRFLLETLLEITNRLDRTNQLENTS
jgi:hypothetical protein